MYVCVCLVDCIHTVRLQYTLHIQAIIVNICVCVCVWLFFILSIFIRLNLLLTQLSHIVARFYETPK